MRSLSDLVTSCRGFEVDGKERYPRENSGGKRLNGTGKRQQKQNGAWCPRIVGHLL